MWVVVFRGVGGEVVPWLVVEKSGCGPLGVDHGVSGEEKRVKGEEFVRKGRLFQGNSCIVTCNDAEAGSTDPGRIPPRAGDLARTPGQGSRFPG